MKEIKLVATDMDHTLLTEKGDLPPHFDDYIVELHQLGVDFAIVSGRPLYTLSKMFYHLNDYITLISDNGGAICHKGKLIYKSLIPPIEYSKIISFTKQIDDGISILCGLDCAYITKNNQSYVDFLHNFYSDITLVDTLDSLNCDANKITIFFPNKTSKSHFESTLYPQFSKNYSVTVGDTIWIDITNKGVDKGHALKILANTLGINSNQMMAFGDTYNDIEMLKAVKYSYIVANANPDIHKYAAFRTKSNEEYGVIEVLKELIEHIKK